MSTRQDLLKAAKERLENEVPDLEQVEIKQLTPVDLSTISLPAVLIYSDSDSRVDNPEIGMEEWLWRVMLEVWANDVDMEDLLPKIHNAMASDETFGQLAHWSRRISADPFVLDSGDHEHGMLISYEINFSHPFGEM